MPHNGWIVGMAAVGAMVGLELARSAVYESTAYTLTHDGAGLFGGVELIGLNAFGWRFPTFNGQPLVAVEVTGSGELGDYTLGSFTITPKAGYLLSDLRSTAGGNFSLVGEGATVGATLLGEVTFDTGVSGSFAASAQFSSASGNGTWTLTSDNPSGGAYRQVSVVDIIYRYSVEAPPGGFARITGSADTGPTFSFNVTAVPEPKTWALLLTGLGLVAWAARSTRAG